MTEKELKQIEEEADKFVKELQEANKREYSNHVASDENAVVVAVTLEMGKAHRPLDVNGKEYLAKKFRKRVRAFRDLLVNGEKGSNWFITVIMGINGKFNSVQHITDLAEMGKVIVNLTENRLTEPDVLDALDADCEPWFTKDPDDTQEWCPEPLESMDEREPLPGEESDEEE